MELATKNGGLKQDVNIIIRHFEHYEKMEKSHEIPRRNKLLCRNDKNGFTLVELSIVIVIIGLLIGGLLVGQSLIESAQINSQVKQIQQYDIALKNFYGKFKGIPGDSTKVTITGACYTADGNGVMRDFIGVVPINWIYSESMCYFPILFTYKFLNVDYVTPAHDFVTYRVGKNQPHPLIKINDDKTRAITALTNRGGDVFYFLGTRQVAQHGNPQISTTSPNGVVSPAQALALDQKMDDGLPLTGNVAASTNQTNSTAGRFYPFNLDTTTCVSAGAYNLSITDNETCRLQIKADNYR